MLELDRNDKKILSLIEYNPRITLKELAKACNLSKDSIKYRLTRLEKQEIILGYTCFIDYKKLSNQSYKLYFKLNSTLEQKNNLRDYLRKQKSVFAIFESVGNWNFAVAIFAKNHYEFNKIENDILGNFGSIITNRRFCTMIDVNIYSKDFFNNPKEKNFTESFTLWGEVENNHLDKIDKDLIKLLHNNSRISLVDLSYSLKLSIDAVKYRIARLRKNNIVKIFKTKINYEKLGFDQYKLFIFPKNYSDAIEQKIIDFLKSTKNCINIIRTIGSWKLEVEFFAEKPGEIESILSELNEKFKDNILDLELSTLRNEELFACKELLLD
ncbi:MAG: Lrp/AsnC family transcriptional regulator [Candidatus Nanoarchaeia archaeon]